MKKLKWILLILTIFLICVFLFATCKKTKALESEFNGLITTISERDQDKYNIVFVYDVANKEVQTDLGIIFFYTTTPQSYNYSMYLDIANNNQLRIRDGGGQVLETDNLSTRLLQVQVVEDLSQLYLIVYCLNYTYQRVQGVAPVVDGISRTMITRYQLPSSILMAWESSDLYISTTATFNYAGLPNYLMNYSFVSSNETPQDINNWVDSLIYNYGIYNNMLTVGYNYGASDGYDSGYSVGLDEGEDIGYSNGYDEGELIGHANGYQEGLNEGYTSGYNTGYNTGYTDGQAGETAITPAFNVLSGVFGVVSTVLQIELVPHVPLGLFFLVPLFFSAIGLILWIWRRN